MELLTQVDAASQIGEQRARMAQDAFTKLEILSKILHTTGSGRDITVDKLAEVIADVKTDLNQGDPLPGHRSPGSSYGGPRPIVQSAQQNEGASENRLQAIESELAKIMKAMSEMKQWSGEAKQNFKEEYDSQMLSLRSQCASLQAELAVLASEAPASDTSDDGAPSMQRTPIAVNQPQSIDAARHVKSQINPGIGKPQEDTFSVSEKGTADDTFLADRRPRKVKFDDNAHSQTSTVALVGATGTVPVDWIVRPVDSGLIANRFLEKGVVNDTGIMIGDQLVEVDGQSVRDLAYNIVMPLLNGPAGSRVRLTVLRGQEPIRLMIERKAFSALRPGSASESRATTPGSEKSERSDSLMAQTGLEETKEAEDKTSFKETAVVGKQRKGFVMMNPAAGSIKWTLHQSPRRLAEQERRMREEEEARIAAAERKQREAEEAARREEEELQRRAVEEARRRAAEELMKRAEAEAAARAKAEAEQKARLMAEAKAKFEAEEEARKAAEVEEARREEEARRKAEEEAARKAAEQERLQVELMAVERARKERIERDRIRMEEDRQKADAALAAGLKAARAFDVAAAKKLLDQAVQITKTGHIVDRSAQIQELRVDMEFAQIKVIEMKVEGEIAQVRVILQREVSPVDGRAFCREDIVEARRAIESARAVCVDLYDPAFYLEHLSRLSSEVDDAESRLLAAPWMDSLGKGLAAEQVAQTWRGALAPAEPEAKPFPAEPAAKALPTKQQAQSDDSDHDEEERQRERMQKKRAVATPARMPVQDALLLEATPADAAPAGVEAAPAEAPQVEYIEAVPELVAQESSASLGAAGSDVDEIQPAASESATDLITDVVKEIMDSAEAVCEVAFYSDNSTELTPEKKTANDETGDSGSPAAMQRAPTFKSKQPPFLLMEEIKSEPRSDDSQFQPGSIPEISHESDPMAGHSTEVVPGDTAEHDVAAVKSITETFFISTKEEAAAEEGKYEEEDVPAEPKADEEAAIAVVEPAPVKSETPALDGSPGAPNTETPGTEQLIAPAFRTKQPSFMAKQPPSLSLEDIKAEPRKLDAEFQPESVPKIAHESDALVVDAEAEETQALDAVATKEEAAAEDVTSDTNSGSAAEKVTVENPEQLEAAKAALRKEVEAEERAHLKPESEREIEASKELQAQLKHREAEKLALVDHMSRDKEELATRKAQLEALNHKLQENQQENAVEHSAQVSAPSEEVMKLQREKEEIMRQMALEKARLVSEYTKLEVINAKLMEDLKAAADLNRKSPSPIQAEADCAPQEELHLAQQKASQEKDELMAQMAKEKQDLIEQTKKLEEAHARIVQETQLATMRLAAEKQSLEEQNRQLAGEKRVAERDLAEEKRLGELSQARERLNVETTRTELPTSIEEERQRMELKRRQEAMQEAIAQSQKEQAEAKRIAQEEERRRMEEERRNILAELEREKAAALEKAAAAEAERARLAAELESECAKLSAELQAERQRAADQAAQLERKLAEAKMNEEERQLDAQRRMEEEEKEKAEEQKMLQEEIEQQRQTAMESMQQMQQALEGENGNEEKLNLSAAVPEEKIRMEEEKAMLLAGFEEEKLKRAEAAEQTETRLEKEKALLAEAAAEAERQRHETIRLEEEQARLPSAAAEAEKARLETLQMQEEPALDVKGPESVERPEEDRKTSAHMPIEIQLVLDMDMDEITDKEEEFKAELCQELCAALNADSSKMAVLQLLAGSIIAHLLLKPGISLVDGVTTEDLVAELMRQFDDPESVLRQGKYGSRAKSLKNVIDQDNQSSHDQVGDLNDKCVQITPQRDNMDEEQPSDATRDEMQIRFIDDRQVVQPPLPKIYDAAQPPLQAVTETKQGHRSSAKHPLPLDVEISSANNAPPPIDIKAAIASIALASIKQKHADEAEHELEQASIQAHKRCRGTLLTISSDWTEAWEGNKAAHGDEDEYDEDDWLGGTLFEKRHDHGEDDARSPEKSESPHLSPLSKRGANRRIPPFKPPRKLDAWGCNDVMPMHKTNLALRQEKSKEQLSYEDVSDEELVEDRPDWYGRNPKINAPQKSPAFPPVQPMPPVKKNPYSTTIPGLNPPVSPLTLKRSKSDLLASACAEDVAENADDVLSVEAQIELGEFLGEMLSSELGEDPVTGPTGGMQWDANPPIDASFLSDLRRWRVPRTNLGDAQEVLEPGTLPSSFPKDDRDAAGGDHSNRLSWMPQLYARSGALSMHRDRAFLNELGDFSDDDVPLAPPREVVLPVIPRANRISYRVGENSKKKWQSYAAMSEHERYAKLRKEAEAGMRKPAELPTGH
jgi:hypothetical protein